MHRFILASLLTISFALVALPERAFAGACPTCTMSAECVAMFGTPAFCVLHDGDVGCGDARQICCPGQGCNVFSGRPSCEGTTCSVVDDMPDAGMSMPDAGMSMADAGTPADDAAVLPGTDGGGSAIDAAPGMDGGSPSMMSAGGCSCRAQSARSAGALPLALAALGLALASRRRKA